eukprot:CAMPEP_0181324834 /NCGR_PEP_ID=MMETSP1101-20121128/20583_1 /TAXON_ID=46948 /ORGANISM="Rhodomonas abbreviata, Strain Caron Lab Isolate" /LENGTH=229 /DNA_ID=CAMNT_0023433061 /DNA_START=1 /DNA_END=690 /DNA_ORIENTATION=+
MNQTGESYGMEVCGLEQFEDGTVSPRKSLKALYHCISLFGGDIPCDPHFSLCDDDDLSPCSSDVVNELKERKVPEEVESFSRVTSGDSFCRIPSLASVDERSFNHVKVPARAYPAYISRSASCVAAPANVEKILENVQDAARKAQACPAYFSRAASCVAAPATVDKIMENVRGAARKAQSGRGVFQRCASAAMPSRERTAAALRRLQSHEERSEHEGMPSKMPKNSSNT